MPPKCEKQLPSFRVKAHLPATIWHPHKDKVFEVKKPTEFEAWAHMMRDTLVELTAGNARLMLGYWADALNTLPDSIRVAIVTAIAQGLGLEITTATDAPDTIEIKLVQRYKPLIGEEKTKSGLVIPGQEKNKLVLPGQQGFQG